MNKWKIDILLKNGSQIKCIYWGDEKESAAVANALLVPGATYFGLRDLTNTKNIIIKTEEVVYMSISF